MKPSFEIRSSSGIKMLYREDSVRNLMNNSIARYTDYASLEVRNQISFLFVNSNVLLESSQVWDNSASSILLYLQRRSFQLAYHQQALQGKLLSGRSHGFREVCRGISLVQSAHSKHLRMKEGSHRRMWSRLESMNTKITSNVCRILLVIRRLKRKFMSSSTKVWSHKTAKINKRAVVTTVRTIRPSLNELYRFNDRQSRTIEKAAC